MVFTADFHLIDPLKFPEQLSKAIQNNLKMLNTCQKYCINEDAENFVVSLSDEELSVFGSNPKQCASAYAVLCEAENHNVVECFKKPVLNSSILQLQYITAPSKYRIHYECHDRFKKIFKYRKVKYDHLTYKEAKECLHDLLGKVVLTSQQVNKEGIVYHDLRLPNMCFDEKYNLILIDLDFSVHRLPEEAEKMNIIELQTFAKDLFDKLEGMDQFRTALEQLEKTERPERYTGTERFTPKETER